MGAGWWRGGGAETRDETKKPFEEGVLNGCSLLTRKGKLQDCSLMRRKEDAA